MTITLLLVGKTDNAQLQSLVAEYQNRLSHFVNYKVEVIPDLKKTKNMDIALQKEKRRRAHFEKNIYFRFFGSFGR